MSATDYLSRVQELFLSPTVQTTFQAGFAITLLFVLRYVVKYTLLRRKMPPGPFGIPFIGNRHQMPARKPWRKFQKLNEEYGMSFTNCVVNKDKAHVYQVQ